MANNKCKECGCVCTKCDDHDVHLHVEIENLKQRLVERDNHIVTMETNFLNEANKYPNGELMALREELATWQDKYKRLYEAHRRVQRVNQGLEDKLLRLVDVCETDKSTLTQDVATLSHKLADANYSIKKLTEDNERYKNDVALAIQFLQCKPGNFVSHKYDTLPMELQSKVSTYMANKRKPTEERKTPPEIKSIKVPIPTFPPTAMVYSVPKSVIDSDREQETAPVDIVSAAIMAKVFEERERERACVKHCDTCTCSQTIKIIHHNTHHTVSTQTGDSNNSLCLKCNGDLESRPSLVKIVKNVDNTKNKSIPVYIHDYIEVNNQNVAKVQPNNFLIDNTNEDLTKSTPKKEQNTLTHHRLCNNKTEICAKFESSDIFKGGRHCSMRLQNGSKNILLDSTPNNVSPVLYTRNGDKKPATPHKDTTGSKITKPDSLSSGDYKTQSSVSVCDNASNERVAEWIQSNLDVGSTSDCSESLLSQRSEDKRLELDKNKYKEMEDNVKRFLFGEYNFLKTVEIGKQKYENAQKEKEVNEEKQ